MFQEPAFLARVDSMSADEVDDSLEGPSLAAAISGSSAERDPACLDRGRVSRVRIRTAKRLCSSQRRIKINYHRQSGVTGPLMTESFKSPACNSRMGAMPGD